MTFEKRNRLADILEAAFETVCDAAWEGFDYAQDGSSQDMREMCQSWLTDPQARFAAALRSLREEA